MRASSRSTVLILCTVTVVVMIGDLAQAQQRRRSRRFNRDTYSVGVALLQEDKVQSELSLTPDQIEKAKEIGEALSADRRDVYAGLSREQRRERGDEFRTKTTELAKTAAMGFGELLDDAQKKRWLEITLQVRGPAALPGEYLAQHLKLNEEQVKKLNDLTSQQREKTFEMFRQAQDQGLSREEGRQRSSALVAEFNKQRLAVLGDEQKVAFASLQGDKFELPED